MRHFRNKKQCSIDGEKGQEVHENKRLAAALEFGPIRSVESLELLHVWTYNPLTKRWNHMILRHDMGNGNDRFNVLLNGKLWPKQWSRTGFVKWVFNIIESVRICC